jgi:serine/threonine-protein kinase
MTADDTIREIHVEVKRCPDCGARFGVDAAFCPFCGVALVTSSWDPTRDALVGNVVDGRYEVHEPLGEGGMGTVYKVRHVTLDRLFAMKVLRRDLAADPGLSARFVQEARATAAIKNPGVVAITDFGALDDGTPYFVMELLSGETLATRMRARGPMAPRDAIAIARKIASALEASHEAGVVHRDLKPENVFLVGRMAGRSAEEDVRLVDFGAAKVVGGSKLTRPGVVFGTPYYMSPEQASGQAIDARADVYSLGVLLYEMITGSVPFEADTYMGVLTKHMFESPERPGGKVAAGIQLGDLEDVIMRALEKEPNARYGSMRELATALEGAARAPGASGAPPRQARAPREGAAGGTGKLSTADRIELSVTRHVLEEQRRKRRSAIVIAACAAAATVAAGGLATAVLGRDDGGTPGASASAVASASAAAAASASAPSASASAPASASAAAAASAPAAPSAHASAPASASTNASASASASPATSTPRSSSATASAARPTRPATRPRPPASVSAPPTSAGTATPTLRPSHPDDLPDPWRKR